jgi:Zn-finger nucleic acid-binding protein
MTRCPYCHALLWNVPVPGVDTDCPICGATIAWFKRGPFNTLMVVRAPEPPGEVTLTEDEAEAKWRRDHEDYYGKSPSPQPIKATGRQENVGASSRAAVKAEEQTLWGRCKYCHAVIAVRNSSYCSYCGARLQPGIIDTTPLRGEGHAPLDQASEATSEQEEKCMVCSVGLKPSEDIVFCPYCGTVAHRVHLLQWIHERKSCPRCGATLDEESMRR